MAMWYFWPMKWKWKFLGGSSKSFWTKMQVHLYTTLFLHFFLPKILDVENPTCGYEATAMHKYYWSTEQELKWACIADGIMDSPVSVLSSLQLGMLFHENIQTKKPKNLYSVFSWAPVIRVSCKMDLKCLPSW